MCGIRSRCFYEIIGFDCGNGTGHFPFLLRTVSDNYHFIDLLGVFDQYDVGRFVVIDNDFFCQVADVRNLQDGFWWNFQGVFPIDIRDCSDRSPFYDHVRTNDGFSVVVGYCTCDGPALLADKRCPALIVLFQQEDVPVVEFVGDISIFESFFKIGYHFPGCVLDSNVTFYVYFTTFENDQIIGLIFNLSDQLAD